MVGYVLPHHRKMNTSSRSRQTWAAQQSAKKPDHALQGWQMCHLLQMLCELTEHVLRSFHQSNRDISAPGSDFENRLYWPCSKHAVSDRFSGAYSLLNFVAKKIARKQESDNLTPPACAVDLQPHASLFDPVHELGLVALIEDYLTGLEFADPARDAIQDVALPPVHATLPSARL